MKVNPIAIASLIINLVTGIFKVEKLKIPGPEKEEAVITGATTEIEKVGSATGVVAWVLVAIKIVRSIISILNEAFGHKWGVDDEEKPPK